MAKVIYMKNKEQTMKTELKTIGLMDYHSQDGEWIRSVPNCKWRVLLRVIELLLLIAGFCLYAYHYRLGEALCLFIPLFIALWIDPYFRLTVPQSIQIHDGTITVTSFILFVKIKRCFFVSIASLHVYFSRNKTYYVLKEKGKNTFKQEAICAKKGDQSIENFFRNHQIPVKHYKSRFSAVAIEDFAR